MTLQDLKKEKIEAMKKRDKEAVAALNVVISKLMILEKSGKGEISELDVITAIQKTEKELIEEREAFLKAGRSETVVVLDRQVEVVKKYLPEMMSEAKIAEIIGKLEDKSVPSVMRHFKENYAGQVEMRLVNEVLRKNN